MCLIRIPKKKEEKSTQTKPHHPLSKLVKLSAFLSRSLLKEIKKPFASINETSTNLFV